MSYFALLLDGMALAYSAFHSNGFRQKVIEAKSITSLVLYPFLCVCKMGVDKMGEGEMGRIIVEMGRGQNGSWRD